jgi:XapX domain-containing protein
VTPRVLTGCALAFAIGVLCRLTGVPLPAPVAFLGSLLVMAMTTGYALVDRHLARTQGRAHDSVRMMPERRP